MGAQELLHNPPRLSITLPIAQQVQRQMTLEGLPPTKLASRPRTSSEITGRDKPAKAAADPHPLVVEVPHLDSNVAKDGAIATKEVHPAEEALTMKGEATREVVPTRGVVPTKQEDLLEDTEEGEVTIADSCQGDPSLPGKKRSSLRATTTSTRPMNSSRRFSQNFPRLKLRIP